MVFHGKSITGMGWEYQGVYSHRSICLCIGDIIYHKTSKKAGRYYTVKIRSNDYEKIIAGLRMYSSVSIAVQLKILFMHRTYILPILNAPLLINPANTGFGTGKDWRIGIFTAISGWYITNPKNNECLGRCKILITFENGWMGIGFLF